MFLHEDSGANTIVPQLASTYGEMGVGTVTVDVRTLDEILSTGLPADLSVDLLKIDVERAELAALRGATATLSGGRVKAIFIEITDVSEPDGSNQATHVDRLLRGYGYRGSEFLLRDCEPDSKPYVPTKVVGEEGFWRNVYYCRG